MTALFFKLFLISVSALLLYRLLFMGRRVSVVTGPFSFFEEDDSDIKIAGKEPVKKSDDALADANELEKHRKNGNLEKARLLGAALSEKIVSQDGEACFGQDVAESEGVRIQRRLLLTFVIANTVSEHIKSNVLQDVILDVFYNKLKQSLPEFYDDISQTGSFSFYTLCARRGGNIEESIADTFAKLSGKEGDPVSKELGKALYLRFYDVISNTIDSFGIKQ
jgi:hypothetical protein